MGKFGLSTKMSEILRLGKGFFHLQLIGLMSQGYPVKLVMMSDSTII
nr:MAG TPA: hypothetical protein [Caudoviricetes sp.]